MLNVASLSASRSDMPHGFCVGSLHVRIRKAYASVELFVHQLWINGLVPKMLTFEGAHANIYIGASRPLIAWLSTRGRLGMRFALAWNVLGLFAVTNVVIRAVLTAPGPFNLIHAEVPNLMVGTFPFLFVPASFVPLAAVLHVLAIRAISSRLRTAEVNSAEILA